VVHNKPHGAAVTLDGTPTGQTTPALLNDVKAGMPHKIHVEIAGGKSNDEIVTIKKRGETVEVKLDLR